MRFVLTDDVDEFAERTRPLLAERIERNIHATVLQYALDGQHPGATFVYGVSGDDDVQFAALRTPPWPMLATELEPQAASQFVETWLAADPEVPGVSGLPPTARAIAAAWAERTGGTTRCRLHEAIHVLDRVSEPRRPASGELRLARDHERALLVDWMQAFAREAGVLGGDEAAEMVDARRARHGLVVWDDNGPMSVAAFSPPVSRVVRIGPVYTPPEHRSRGYATNLVAALSRQALAGGAERCMLYTDLANPTSNKIYAEIGYRRVGDWEDHEFNRRGS